MRTRIISLSAHIEAFGVDGEVTKASGLAPDAIYFVAERRKPSGLSTKNTVAKPEGSRPTDNKTTRLGAKVDGFGLAHCR